MFHVFAQLPTKTISLSKVSSSMVGSSMKLVIVILLSLLWHRSMAIESKKDNELYPWKERHRYYYPSIDVKTKELLDATPGCVSKVKTQKAGVMPSIPTSDDELYIASMPVSSDVVKWWKAVPRPTLMRVDPNLCEAVMKAKKQPIFTNRGCQLEGYMNPAAPRCQTKYLKWACYGSSRPINDTTVTSFVIPESDHPNAELPPQPWILTARNAFVSMCGHISSACGLVHTTANCKAISHESVASAFYDKCPRSLLTKDDIQRAYQSGLKNGTCMVGAPYTREYEYHKRVFVVGEVDDSYVYHLHLEIIPRLVYHLEFLQQHPEIKILIGCDTKKNQKGTDMGMRHMLLSMKPLMDLAGLSMDRLVVHKHVFAREVYLPMEGGCQDPVYNTWQILSMRKRFFKALNITQSGPGGYADHLVDSGSGGSDSGGGGGGGSGSGSGNAAADRRSSKGSSGGDSSRDRGRRRSRSTRGKEKQEGPGTGRGSGRGLTSISKTTTTRTTTTTTAARTARTTARPVILLMKRSTGAKHTRNAEDLVRQWNDRFTDRLLTGLRSAFPSYDVKLFSDKDEQLMGCHACQIRAFAEADVLIGMHGAGLSNQLYMKPNSAVIELCPYPNDGRCLLGGGPFSRIAAVMSHNYLIHQPPKEEFKWILKDRTSEFDVGRFVTHIHSYLTALGALGDE